MNKSRRVITGGLALLCFLAGMVVFSPIPAGGQVVIKLGPEGQPMPAPPMNSPSTATTPSQFSAIKLLENPDFRKLIEGAGAAIRDAVKNEKDGKKELATRDWNDAVEALQTILDNKEDFYVQIKERDPKGTETSRWTSVKFEANNLIGSMPDVGLDIYELKYGAKASQLLDEAKQRGDRELLADVAQRYLHTRAGADANDMLATYFLDRGQFFMAALRFERLLAMNPERIQLSDLTLYKAALAFRRSGEVLKAEEAWRRLEQKILAKGGLKVGEDVVPMARLQQVLEEIPRPETVNPHDWPLIRGNATNSAQANGSPPMLDQVLWQRPTLLDNDAPFPSEAATWVTAAAAGSFPLVSLFYLLSSGEVEEGKFADTWVNAALGAQPPNAPLLPGSFPIVAGKLMIYRTYMDIRAVHLHDGKDSQGQPARIGKIAWKSTPFHAALVPILEDLKTRPTLETWLRQYQSLPGFMNLVYENTLLGSIATDQRLVYVVDDLAVPAPPNVFTPYVWNQPNQAPQELKPKVMQNSLHAYELHTGKLKYMWGGEDYLKYPDKKDGPFADSHFLGVPMSVGGKLYVLNEKNFGTNGEAELRLVCLDPSSGKVIPPIQTLGIVQQQHRVTHDISRRTNAVHLAYGEGILVCPTHAGEVLGVDLLSRSLAWAYPYRQEAPTTVQLQPAPVQPFPAPNSPTFPRAVSSNWKSAPPVIVDGKVVFTAPDAQSVHCINLRDGTPVWKKPQDEGDLYLAGVYQGKVIIVGRNWVRALRLADGEKAWYIPTGSPPSGQGVASKNVYYLPLRGGEIRAIDIEKGEIKAHNRAKPGSTPPGNLVFYEGMVLSQTAREVFAYPQLVARLQLANEALLVDPNDPEKLVNRGELLLADGQVQNAVNDLKSALGKNPPAGLAPRAKEKLYEALTDLFQVDFNHASAKYLDEYSELCKVPADDQEKQQRLAKFYRLMGQGREGQGNLVEAFQMYREYGALPINQQAGVASLDDPTHRVPAHVWLKGRISTMMAKAKPDQRAPLEVKIAEDWQRIQAKKDLDAIRSFVSMFDVPFAVGREARLELAEAILGQNQRPAFLEAELNLNQLLTGSFRKNPKVGGKALSTLALLEEKKGSAEAMKLAASYYRELGKSFADVVIRDGKTGNDLFSELATDKRFLPYLEESGNVWGVGKIGVREVPNVAVPAGMQGFIFQPEGEVPSIFKQRRLVLDPSNGNSPQLRLVDLASNQVLWTVNLGSVPMNFQFYQYLYQQGQANIHYQPNARFRFFQAKGHLAVFQVGTMVYALDLDQPKILWQHSLLDGNPLQPNMVVQQIMPDRDGNLELIVWNQFNGHRSRSPLGQVGAVEASHVAVVTQKGLVVLDPLRGTTLWSKLDVPARTQVFGDEDHLFLVDLRDSGAAGASRALRASDGTPVDFPDFSAVYQNKLHIFGRKILAGIPAGDGYTIKLYDIPTGKDVWSQTFDAKSIPLSSNQAEFAGVIEPSGRIVVVDAHTGKKLLDNTVVNERVTADDLKNLHQPLILGDGDRFYLALNKAVDSGKVAGGIISNNFANGLRCNIVNGWVLAYGRKPLKIGGRDFKTGAFLWHSHKPIENQMLVLEQFDTLPVLLLTARYNEMINGGAGGNRWISLTQSLHKQHGKMVWNPDPRPSNSAAQYYAFTMDPRAGTINLVGYNGALQHFIDDGRKGNVDDPGPASPGLKTGQAIPYQPFGLQPPLPPNVQLPPNFAPGRRIVIQALPVPVEKK